MALPTNTNLFHYCSQNFQGLESKKNSKSSLDRQFSFTSEIIGVLFSSPMQQQWTHKMICMTISTVFMVSPSPDAEAVSILTPLRSRAHWHWPDSPLAGERQLCCRGTGDCCMVICNLCAHQQHKVNTNNQLR